MAVKGDTKGQLLTFNASSLDGILDCRILDPIGDDKVYEDICKIENNERDHHSLQLEQDGKISTTNIQIIKNSSQQFEI